MQSLILLSGISIHPPRVGRDQDHYGQSSHGGRNFNPPSPCGEGQASALVLTNGPLFQSTLPVWGGTQIDAINAQRDANFNPPSPCGEGPAGATNEACGSVFQSTLPVWGGTVP